VVDHCLDGVFTLREGVEGKIVGLKVQLDCLKVCRVFRDHTSCVTRVLVVELEGLLGYTFQFLQLDEV
jgi:hypothetical protein